MQLKRGSFINISSLHLKIVINIIVAAPMGRLVRIALKNVAIFAPAESKDPIHSGTKLVSYLFFKGAALLKICHFCGKYILKFFDVHLEHQEIRFYKWAMACRSGRSA